MRVNPVLEFNNLPQETFMNYLIRTLIMTSGNIHLLLEKLTSGIVYQITLLTLIFYKYF